MKFTRENTGALTVRRVADGEISIGAETYSSTLVLTPDAVHPNWSDKAFADLDVDDFNDLLAAKPEVLVIGTGAKNRFPPRELLFAMARRGVGLEVMDTAAAARTFNVLAGEDRRVTAVLYI